MSEQRTTEPRSTDDRLADTEIEDLLDEEAEVDVPDDERPVVEDVNEHVPDDDGRDPTEDAVIP